LHLLKGRAPEKSLCTIIEEFIHLESNASNSIQKFQVQGKAKGDVKIRKVSMEDLQGLLILLHDLSFRSQKLTRSESITIYMDGTKMSTKLLPHSYKSTCYGSQ